MVDEQRYDARLPSAVWRAIASQPNAGVTAPAFVSLAPSLVLVNPEMAFFAHNASPEFIGLHLGGPPCPSPSIS